MKYTILYDGTFAGFLSAVFEVYDRKLNQVIIHKAAADFQPLFERVITVGTTEEKSIRVWKGFSKKVSSRSASGFYAAFLSELKGMENTLLQMMQYVFANDKPVDCNFGNPDVLKVTKVAKMVHREKHRMEAFIRFQLTADGMYYAVIDPDFNVLPLISTHFTRRYADQRWMIYDEKRKYGLYYDLQKTTSVEIAFAEENKPAKLADQHIDVTEAMYERLWRTYFKNVNISARKNTKLHLRHVPLRYWKYLTEKQPEIVRGPTEKYQIAT
ncbi:MAG: TIGR03915 family putative DNA repair protein, partial [Chitinophagales bacterium]